MYHYKNMRFHPTLRVLYLLMGTASLSFQSKAAWVIVGAGSKDAWRQPPLFSDALNHCFPEESWRIPRLPQIQLCLFRCWLHTQEQSGGRPSSHCILGSATIKTTTHNPKTHTPKKPHPNKKQAPKTLVQFLQVSYLFFKGLNALPESAHDHLPSP